MIIVRIIYCFLMFVVIAGLFACTLNNKVSPSYISQPDLIITRVENNGGDYVVTVRNQGLSEVSQFFYICMWEASYEQRYKDKGIVDYPACNNVIIANYDGETQAPRMLKAGEELVVMLQGIYNIPSGEKLYFIVDKSENDNNSVHESDETNNLFTYIQQ